MKLINVGHGNLVNADKVISVISPEAAPIKRLIVDSREGGKLIDATSGKKTRSVLVAESGHVILSALNPETIQGRFNDENTNEKDVENEQN